MAKLQVRLLVVIVLGTISWCEEVGGSSPKVAVMRSASPPWGCGPPKTVNVSFNKIKVKGPDSDVVYQGVTVRDVHIDFATNTSVSLPGDSFFECAKAAASAGLDAFVFNGSCTGYLLNLHFLKCQTGDLTIYVLPDYVIEEPVVVPLDEAPFKPHSNNRRKYMLSAIVETENDYPMFQNTETTIPLDFYYNVQDVIYRENGDTFLLSNFIVDLNSCLSDGSYGLLFDVRQSFYDFPGDIMFFFEECGNTVQVRRYPLHGSLFVYSHPGLGCQYYPSGLPDECTVTFEVKEVKNSGKLSAAFAFWFPETASGDGGLNMTITEKDPKNGMLKSQNIYQKNSRKGTQFSSTIEVSLLRQPSKRAIGFYMAFNVFDL